ncbi:MULTISPECIES: putative motility protein [unclassified Candidatus Frackibacter]|uniref:putative motility protein n=1 Tax=unclassified Candidatus Frackibacter TaxID=2648818 RepID=UPI00088291F3|nr:MULTISPECIES: putative motility protein [unclassified Candidatus Frackibacter]SDC84062.1 Putative motility protein [Candidatus Frackibacter sp. WG11]SEM98538.1 Putative motility protein [Candidatus Frackibacter sp. WG12]SFM05149.1 Putative motility protein [Candidatus Frackibacter sp. WG13]
MEISSAMQSQLASVRQALGMTSLQKAMNQDGTTVSKLLEGMEENTKAIQKAAQPHLGSNVDIRV